MEWKIITYKYPNLNYFLAHFFKSLYFLAFFFQFCTVLIKKILRPTKHPFKMIPQKKTDYNNKMAPQK